MNANTSPSTHLYIHACLYCTHTHTLLTWFLDGDVDVEEDLDGVRKESGPPVDDKHDAAAEQRPQQGQPHVVEPVSWSPAYRGNASQRETQSVTVDSWKSVVRQTSF